MKTRRKLVVAFGASSLAASFASLAQSRPAPMFRLGVLFAGTVAASESYYRAFFESLSGLGYVEGKNLLVVRRFADGRIDRLDAMAAELVAAQVNVIFAPPTPAVRSAMKASATIPIVFCLPPYPVETGLVKSLARPGSNATGLSTMGAELMPKRIELIRELVPKARRIGLLYDSREPAAVISRESAFETARLLGLTVVDENANHRDQLTAAFAAFNEKRADVLVVSEGSLGTSNRNRVVSLAAANRLPAVYSYPEFPAEGGLISYGANTADQYRRAAVFVDKLFKGAKPADLPVEQPIKFDLFVNSKTAKTLGLAIPYSILLRATSVIE